MSEESNDLLMRLANLRKAKHTLSDQFVKMQTVAVDLVKQVELLKVQNKIYTDSIARVLVKQPNAVNQNEAVDMAVEFQLELRTALHLADSVGRKK